MSFELGRGFNRLFLVLTIAWVVCCAVLYPLRMQFEGQRTAIADYNRGVKTCQQLMVENPNSELDQNCFDEMARDEEGALKLHSFKNFWVYDVAFWQLEIPAIALPLIAFYTLAVVGRWLWRGFKPPTGGSVSV